MRSLRSASAAETHRIARAVAGGLRRRDVVALEGELGAGKTQFVQGVAEYFSVVEPVTSPSFVLLNRYTGKDSDGTELLLYHFDLYRIRSEEELYDIGFEEFLRKEGIVLVEWADRFPSMLPADRVDVRLRHGIDASTREIEIQHREETVAIP